MCSGLDLAEIKAAASFAQILDHYHIMVRGSGPQRIALCPFHPDKRPSCSINLDRKIFHCFGCEAHGTILDFVALLERISIRAASIRIAAICAVQGGDDRAHQDWVNGQRRHSRVRTWVPKIIAPMQDLDPTHPYIAERGVAPKRAAALGLGFCDHGIMRGRICIPIYDDRGNLVAYAGRIASAEIPKGIMKYYIPRGFEKRHVLFGLHRVIHAKHLVLVEGYWSVFRLHKLGVPAVALMGRTLSVEQELLLRKSNAQKLTLLFDGDRAGREATELLLPKLAPHFIVQDGMLPDRAEPDTVPEEYIFNVLL